MKTSSIILTEQSIDTKNDLKGELNVFKLLA